MKSILLIVAIFFAFPVFGATWEETRRAEQAKHEQLMRDARKERAAEEERWIRTQEAEKERQSRERIERIRAETERRKAAQPIHIYVH